MTVLIIMGVVILSLGLSVLEKALSVRGLLSGRFLSFRRFYIRDAEVMCAHPLVLMRRDFEDGLRFPYTFVNLHCVQVDGGVEFSYRLPFWLSFIAIGAFALSIFNAGDGELTKVVIGIPFCLLVVVIIWVFSTPSIESVRHALMGKGVLRPGADEV